MKSVGWEILVYDDSFRSFLWLDVEFIYVKHFYLCIDRLQELALENLPESTIQSRPKRQPLDIAIVDTMWCPRNTDSRHIL